MDSTKSNDKNKRQPVDNFVGKTANQGLRHFVGMGLLYINFF
jgi:hypothetical protein